MATDEALPPEAAPVPPARRRRHRWISASVLGFALLLALAIVGAVIWLDTPGGHRFIIGQVHRFQPVSGLRVTIGSIEGSIYKHARLRDVRVYDPKGQFARIEDADLQWYPLGWFSNRLDIDHLRIARAQLDRIPAFNPGRGTSSVLPGFDIRLMELSVGRLALGPGVAGRAHLMRLRARADVRRGRAVIDLDAFALDTSDALRLSLDSRPDDRKFDIDAQLSAPAGGIIGGLTGIKVPMAAAVRGDGNWRLWRGRLVALASGRQAVNLALEAREGRYALSGPVALLGPLEGLGRQLRARGAMLKGDFTFADRVVRGTLRAGTTGLAVSAQGGVDLGRNRFDGLTLDVRLDGLGRLVSGATGKDARLRARLSGAFDAMGIEYLLTAPELRQGRTALLDLKLSGAGRLEKGVTQLPLALTARALQLGFAPADAQLRGVAANGTLTLAGNRLSTGPIQLRASGFKGTIKADADLAQGRFAVDLNGRLSQLAIPGLGVVDLDALVRYGSGARGQAAFSGRAAAAMRRLDNGFLRGLAGGLPRVTSDLGFDGRGQLLLRNLRLSAPDITLAANGYRRADGAFHFEGAGTHKSYGPLRLTLDGAIDRPKVDLLLARPMPAAGLANVRLLLTPDAAGYQMSAQGGSTLGPFTLAGAVLLPSGGEAVIDIARLAVSDVVAAGRLVAVTGGLQGTLQLSGPARGPIRLGVTDGIQTADLDLVIDGARFEGSPAIAINRGTVKAQIALRPGATSIDARLQARGIRYGTVRMNRFAAAVKLVNGSGQAVATMVGQGGRLFDLQARAAITPDRIGVDLAGTIAGQPIRQTRRAVVTREDGGWRLAPAAYSYRGGKLSLSGLLGATSTHVEATMEQLPLAVLDLANSDLGLGGTASGTLLYDAPRGGVPTGRANIRIRRLTRSGFALSSAPIDVGLNAEIGAGRAAMRAVVADGGKVIGRAQALIAPLGSGSLMQRLNAAPLRGALRYAGNADTLWRLTNVELFQLGGNLEIAADVGGTLADPQISGLVRTRDARLTSPVTGMALDQIAAEGRFNGSQLTISTLRGRSKNGGTVAGTALLSFSGERGIGMDIALQADRAVLLDRDDIGATVTGPLRIQSTGDGGVISGNLRVVESRFTLGRAAAVAEIPRIRVVEINRRGEETEAPRAASPWRLEMKAVASRRLMVEGLGMQSEWSADLDIGGTVTSPSLVGTATLVRGDYDFAGKTFELREGRLRFNGNVPINPTLDIRAEADVSDLSATISVTGTSLQPIISFTSIPALPQDELLSRLLFGTSITNLSAPEAIQLATAVAAFQGGGGGLDPINAVRKATGLSRLRILPADSTTGQQTSIAAGKYITNRIYAEFITDGQGYSATRLEYQITRWLSLLSSVSTIGLQSINARVSRDY